jgi:PAS domain S-box-containing protein
MGGEAAVARSPTVGRTPLSDDDHAAGSRHPAGNASEVRDAFEHLPVMALAMAGPEHAYAAVNAMFRRFMGRTELIGVPSRQVFPELDGQRVFEMFDRVYHSGTAETLREWRFQADLGTGAMQEIYLDVQASPWPAPDGTVKGLLLVVNDVTRVVRERQAAEVRAVAAQQRYETARDVIITLQQQLLPAGLPVLPSVGLAASYLLAGADTAAGGDWFDAVALPGGRVAMVVGDVVGHGVAASAAMGQLRAVIQDRLDQNGDILAAVAAADRMAVRVPHARTATVCVAVLDPDDGTLTWCAAGHPPPLVAGPGRARFLDPSSQGPLGTGARYTLQQDRLGPDEVVLLYTDGIIERPGHTPAAATAELAAVVGDIVAGRGLTDPGLSPADKVCLYTLELLIRQSGHSDDITLLAAQRRTPVPALVLDDAGAPPTARTARIAVNAWVDELGADEDDRLALTHAVSELVTNAREHSRPDTADSTVTVTAELGDDGVARLTVADNGRWRERPRPGDSGFRQDHGLGLVLTQSFGDRLDVIPGEHGTTVTLHRRLSRHGRLLTADQLGRATTRSEADSGLMIILDQPHAASSRIAVHGPLDTDTVDEFRVTLDRHTLGGTHPLIVDLTAVTHLASAAVAELYRTDPTTADRRHYPLTLYAPPGTVAHHVLTLVDLPHTTADPHTP